MDMSRLLPKMLTIDWQRGPDLPQGFQDSDAGIVDGVLVTATGFNQGRAADEAVRPGKHRRGFLRRVWGLELARPEAGWQDLPDLPGAARQGVMAEVVDDRLYLWGGFSYEQPQCYADGYRLSRQQGNWRWEPLPPLPYPLTAAGICSLGSRIYLFGGAEYAEDFLTYSDRAGTHHRLGARLWVCDTAASRLAWEELPECPGTPRLNHAVAAVAGKIYVLGGATGSDHPGSRDPEARQAPDWSPYCNAVDNWRFDPARNRWERLGDLPTSSSNFPDNRIIWRDRYLLLVGGFQYRRLMRPDDTWSSPYGPASRVEDCGEYFCDVLVYDALTGAFGTADPLPINNCMPAVVVQGDLVYTIGGECDGRRLDGVYYGHHPDLFLAGRISLIG